MTYTITLAYAWWQPATAITLAALAWAFWPWRNETHWQELFAGTGRLIIAIIIIALAWALSGFLK